MDKDFVLHRFQTEYLIQWRNAQREKNREKEKQLAIANGDIHKVITMNIEQAETRYRIEEIQRLANGLGLDWKEVRKLAEEEKHLWNNKSPLI